VVLYQEQAMQIAKDLAGFSGAKADDLRKAIGKKNRQAMAKLKPEFFDGCVASGTSPETTEWLWQTNERSADYSFNRSPRRLLRADRLPHGLAAGQSPAEYMAALISSVMDTKDKVPYFVAAARRWASRSCRPTSTSQTTSSSSSKATSASGWTP
jgi:DNA polymerase-3 subunit alpha